MSITDTVDIQMLAASLPQQSSLQIVWQERTEKPTTNEKLSMQKMQDTFQSNSVPITINCPASGSHSWTNLGDIGDKNYQCKKCGVLVKSNGMPTTINCTSGNSHSWTKL